MTTCHAATLAPPTSLGDVEQVLRCHQPRCLRVALQVTRDHHHAQDAVQEAFLAFTLNPSGYDPARGSIGGWLAMLTHRRAVDLVRREHSRPRPTQTTAVAHPDTHIDPENQAEEAIRTDQVHFLLRTLDPTKRQIMYLTYYLGYTQIQIAAATGMPLGTVKTRSRTALHQLRTTITTPHLNCAQPPYPLLLAS